MINEPEIDHKVDINLVDEDELDRDPPGDRPILKALNSFVALPTYKKQQLKYQLALLEHLNILNFDFCMLPSLLTSTFKNSNHQLLSNWLKILKFDIGYTAMFKKLAAAGFSWPILQENFYDCPPRPHFDPSLYSGRYLELYNDLHEVLESAKHNGIDPYNLENYVLGEDPQEDAEGSEEEEEKSEDGSEKKSEDGNEEEHEERGKESEKSNEEQIGEVDQSNEVYSDEESNKSNSS